MGIWSKQIAPALTVALGFVAAVYAPWSWLRWFAIVLVLAYVFVAARNPIYFYRRMLRRLVLVGSGLAALGVSGRVSGSPDLPSGWGPIEFLVEWGSGPGLWFILAFAVICLIGDLFVTGLEFRRNAQVLKTSEVDVQAAPQANNGLELSTDLTIIGPDVGLTLTEGLIRIGTLWPRTIKCELYEVRDRLREPASDPIRVASSESVTVGLEAAIPPGRPAIWLLWRLRHLSWLGALPGEVVVKTAVGQPTIVVDAKIVPSAGRLA